MAATATDKDYHKYEKLLMWTVHKFIETHGGDFDELMGEANMMFLKVRQIYEDAEEHERTSSFSNYLRFRVYKHFLECHRNETRHRRIAPVISIQELERNIESNTGEPSDITEIALPAPVHKFWLFEFLDELSEDAKLVTRLAVDTPIGLNNIMLRNGGRPHNRKAVIRHYLSARGWDPQRIAQSFSEIATALSY